MAVTEWFKGKLKERKKKIDEAAGEPMEKDEEEEEKEKKRKKKEEGFTLRGAYDTIRGK